MEARLDKMLPSCLRSPTFHIVLFIYIYMHMHILSLSSHRHRHTHTHTKKRMKRNRRETDRFLEAATDRKQKQHGVPRRSDRHLFFCFSGHATLQISSQFCQHFSPHTITHKRLKETLRQKETDRRSRSSLHYHGFPRRCNLTHIHGPAFIYRLRSYHTECTASRPISEVKLC